MTLCMIVVTVGQAMSVVERLGRWANVDDAAGLWLIVFGFIAYGLFFTRWLVQWISTERRGTPHVPMAFWWMSLGGAALLSLYFAFRGEPVGLIGQSVGWIVYVRNITIARRQPRVVT